jgi:hypothetical protein
MFAAQQFGREVPGSPVVADQLGAKLFGRAQEVNRGRVLAAHGVRAG